MSFPWSVLTVGVVGRAALLVAFCALVVAAIALQFAKVRALYGGDEMAETRVNCPSCGARVAAEDACAYCGESLDDGSAE